MTGKCSVCSHKDVDLINSLIISGASKRSIADQFNLSPTSVQRHKSHVPVHLAKAKEAEIITHADSLLSKTRELLNEAEAITRQSRSAGDLKTALSGIGRIKDILELLLKVTGELENKTEVNIFQISEWIEIKTVILKALLPYPEARQACADALKNMPIG